MSDWMEFSDYWTTEMRYTQSLFRSIKLFAYLSQEGFCSKSSYLQSQMKLNCFLFWLGNIKIIKNHQ